MGDCWVAGRNLGKSHCVACEVHFAPSCETEPGDCAEGCTRYVLEQALEEELERRQREKKIEDFTPKVPSAEQRQSCPVCV